MRRKLCLVGGVVAPLLYVATDILAALRWQGYSYPAQTISETFALGAPTRPLVLLRGLGYSALVLAFGTGVWESAGGRRPLRVEAGWLVGIAVVVFGTLAGLDGPRVAANLPTPWVGVTERLSVFSYMLWLGVFALGLLRGQRPTAPGRPQRAG